jgi:hypothetical protein
MPLTAPAPIDYNVQQTNPLNSLGSMLNIANSAQNLQRGNIQLQNEQATQQAVQDQIKAQSTSAQEGAKQAQTKTLSDQFKLTGDYAQKARDIASSMLGDPAVEKGDINGINDLLDKAQTQMTDSGIPKDVAAVQVAHARVAAVQNPSAFKNFLANAAQIGTGATGIVSQNMLPASSQTGLTPSPYGGPASVVSRDRFGSAPVVTSQDNPQGVNPPSTGAGTQDQGASDLKYPVRQPGNTMPMQPNEANDLAAGQGYRQSLSGASTGLAQNYRNIDEVVKQAKALQDSWKPTTGVLGAITRKVSNWAGDPEYIQLSKDLANVQISNIKAQGGSMDTVAGQQLTHMANGDETYPPEVLLNIAARAKADTKNTELQGLAANEYAKKYGDANLNTTFKQQWSQNADSTVFQGINIIKDVKDPKERQKQLDNLFGTDPAAKQDFLTKYRNIKAMLPNGAI